MDCVTKDTPIVLKITEKIRILKFDEIIIDEACFQDEYVGAQWGAKEFGDCINIQVWTTEGWRCIKKNVRHKTEKDIYRIRTKHAFVDVTEDHSLSDKNREIIKPWYLLLGEELLHNHIDFGESKTTFDEIYDKIYNREAETLEDQKMFIKGSFLRDGSSQSFKYKSGLK